MIIVSSLSPNHINKEIQLKAIESWKQFGDAYCLQNPIEYEQLKENYPDVNFIKTERTIEKLIKKKLVTINAFLDFAKSKQEDILIINSDIELKALPIDKQDGISVFQRYDYENNNYENSKLFTSGFDGFYIPFKFLNIFPPSIYAMGACWWDYWLPYWTIKSQVPLYYLKGKFAFHKKHPMQYSMDEWQFIGEFFRLEFKLKGYTNIGQMNLFILDQIIKNLK